MVITKKRAKADPVLKLVIAGGSDELAYHGKVRINTLIRKLNLQIHRDIIKQGMRVVRSIWEDEFGPLTPFDDEGACAGTHGKGSGTVGYVRTISAFADVIDESLNRKQRLANGITKSHNELASDLSGVIGETRDEIEVVTVLIGETK